MPPLSAAKEVLMMVLKFYFIPNMEKFTALVAACRGRVLVRREEAFQNLKGDDEPWPL